MYKCSNCGWEFDSFTKLKTDWCDDIEGCPNCFANIMEYFFIQLESTKADNSKVKIINISAIPKP